MDGDLTKNIVIIACFFLLTPLALAISAFSLIVVSKSDISNKQVLAAETQANTNIFASLPKEVPEVNFEIKTQDARAEILRQYLARYNSPLEPYADLIVSVADENRLDFRLLVAIAQQESNLCKYAPEETYNCWGWGIHKRGTLGFQSYEEGINTVAQGIKQNYIDEGYVTVEHIMTKYTPSSPGSWAKGVKQFMAEME